MVDNDALETSFVKAFLNLKSPKPQFELESTLLANGDTTTTVPGILEDLQHLMDNYIDFESKVDSNEIDASDKQAISTLNRDAEGLFTAISSNANKSNFITCLPSLTQALSQAGLIEAGYFGEMLEKQFTETSNAVYLLQAKLEASGGDLKTTTNFFGHKQISASAGLILNYKLYKMDKIDNSDNFSFTIVDADNAISTNPNYINSSKITGYVKSKPSGYNTSAK
jgi:hypothetical protein